MSALERRGAAIGERLAARHRARLAEAFSEAGVRADIEGDAVVLRGRGLTRRMLAESALRGVRP